MDLLKKNSFDHRFVLYGFVEGFAESLPRFTCSICDVKSGSDSSSSGKYRSSSKLQSIGNTIIQNSGASLLTYSSFTGILGTTEMTRHTSVGRESASSFSSVSPTLSPDIKSANLMDCLTVWLRGASLAELRNFSILGSHLSPHLSSDVGECSIFIIKEILFDFICFLFSLRTITSIGSGTSLALASVYSPNRWLSIFIIFTFIIIGFIINVGVPQHVDNFHVYGILHFFFIFILSLSGGATGSPVLGLAGEFLRPEDYDRSWILPLEESANDGIPWRILQGVDRQDKCHHGFSFGPIFDVAYWWRRISGKLHRMSRPNLFLFLFSHHLFEALASRLVFPSTETFQWWIPECAVRVSHPDVHRVVTRGADRCALRADVSAEWGLLVGLSKSVPYTEVAAVLATTAWKSTLPNWMVAPELPVLITAFASWMLAPRPSWTVKAVFCRSICMNERQGVWNLSPDSFSCYDSTEMTSQRWKEKPIPSGVARNLWAPKIRAPASARISLNFKGTNGVLTE
ncbi:hypothetical protein M5K25_011362 [Dendrobium thyrsiflorum]|uniref:Uncharacterized protein n=1 Tax=Dendrobium thyrsiflorum TaxID=117978 RepID=A0ABD0V9M2_DENTH